MWRKSFFALIVVLFPLSLVLLQARILLNYDYGGKQLRATAAENYMVWLYSENYTDDVVTNTSSRITQSSTTITTNARPSRIPYISNISGQEPVLACQNAFLAGIEPFEHDRTINETLSSSSLSEWSQVWRKNNCDALFCRNAARRRSRKDTYCQWSPFAIESIMPQNASATVCTDAQVEGFFSDPKWDHYRLSDYWKGLMVARLKGKVKWQDFKTGYPGSLMHEYHEASIQLGVRNGNWPLMMKLLRERAAALPPEERLQPNSLLIHLRLGDVIDYSVESVPELLLKEQHYYRRKNNNNPKSEAPIEPWVKPNHKPLSMSWNRYVQPLEFYSKLLQNHSAQHEYDSVVIMGSAHQGEFDMPQTAFASCLYTRALENYFKRFSSRNLNVMLRLGRSPDEDIIFASQAKAFVSSGGGYSRFLADVSYRFGAKIIKPL